MTEVIDSLFYMVDDLADKRYTDDEKAKELSIRRDALQDKIILRLGEDGQELMEALADLSLKLEVIHDQALFRAAMQLGASIAGPGAGLQAAPVLSAAPAQARDVGRACFQ